MRVRNRPSRSKDTVVFVVDRQCLGWFYGKTTRKSLEHLNEDIEIVRIIPPNIPIRPDTFGHFVLLGSRAKDLSIKLSRAATVTVIAPTVAPPDVLETKPDSIILSASDSFGVGSLWYAQAEKIACTIDAYPSVGNYVGDDLGAMLRITLGTRQRGAK